GFAQFNEARHGRQTIADQQKQLAAQQEQLKHANDVLSKLADSTERLQKTISLGETLRVSYGPGVCLIYGSYTFVEAGTGRPLRMAESQSNEGGNTIQNGTNQKELTPESNGTIAETHFEGSVFHTGV